MATPIPANDAGFTLDEVARATSGELRGSAVATHGVVTDSREVRPGCLFVALRGERLDAHEFLAAAVEAGAAAVIVARDARPRALGVPLVAVEDTTTALGDLALHHRRRWGREVVAITGSAGKTTTKELTAAALASAGVRVHRTRGNLNNLVGVPMTLFELDGAVDVAVVEMGTSKPGEIARLAAIGEPDVAVVTLVAAAHTEGLGEVADVAEEKASIYDALRPSGTGIVNADDEPLCTAVARRSLPRRITFGAANGADVRLLDHRLTETLATHASFEVRGRQGAVELDLALLGEAAARNAAAALAVALARGDDLAEAARGLEAIQPTPGRMCRRDARSGVCVLDDTYNASPRSTAVALETASAVARTLHTRLVAVLGDMKELGPRSRAEHETVARSAVRLADAVILVGPEMEPAARVEAARTPKVKWAESAGSAVPLVEQEVRPGDVVLVKGSRAMRTELVVDALLGGGGS